MAINGGHRTGAGRPKGTVSVETKKKQLFEKYLLEEVMKEKEAVVKALIRTAKKNNIQAIKEILDRILGRAKESIELSGDKNNPIPMMDLTVMIKNENKRNNKKI